MGIMILLIKIEPLLIYLFVDIDENTFNIDANLIEEKFKNLDGKVKLYEPITNYQLEQFKRFYINSLGKTAKHYYGIIRDKASEIGVFTYELDSLSNATRVFWGDYSLYDELILEQQAVKELFLYFYKRNPQEGVFRLLNEMEPLDFDGCTY